MNFRQELETYLTSSPGPLMYSLDDIRGMQEYLRKQVLEGATRPVHAVKSIPQGYPFAEERAKILQQHFAREGFGTYYGYNGGAWVVRVTF